LRAGDQIVSVGGTAVGNVIDALVAMASVKAGDELPMTVLRGNGAAAKRMEIKVAVTKVPVLPAEPLLLTKMGVEGVTVTEEMAKKEGLAVNRGIWVKKVTEGSPAGKAKIQAGDVLYQLGPYYVGSVEDAETLLKTVKQEIDVQIGIVRGEQRGRGVVRIK
jgi:S1-C subfamily serine protease